MEKLTREFWLEGSNKERMQKVIDKVNEIVDYINVLAQPTMTVDSGGGDIYDDQDYKGFDPSDIPGLDG